MASASAAAAGALILWQVSGLVADRGAITGLITGAAALAGTVLVAGIWGTVAPAAWWDRRLEQCSGWLALWRQGVPCEHRGTGVVLSLAGLAGYLLLSGALLGRPDDPWDDDQGAFLHAAAQVHRDGGPWRLVADLYAGRFAEANRHPLYIGLLSVRPDADFGRRLSWGGGVLTLLVLTTVAWHRSGPLTAGLFALLLGTNMAFLTFSSRVVCDGLMVLWGGLVYGLTPVAPGQNMRQRVLRSALVGGVLGLAYLTKGTGLLLVVGWAAFSLCAGGGSQRARPWRARLAELCVMLLAWGVVASPLLVRNIVRYGSPAHNVNAYLLFADTYDESLLLAERQSVGEAARTYLRTHTGPQMIARGASGLVWESFILTRLLGPFPLDDARVLPGLVLGLLSVLSIVGSPRPEHVLLGAWLLVCVPLFGWYVPIAAGDRFPLPLLAPLLFEASRGLTRWLGLLAGRRRRLPTPATPHPSDHPLQS